MKASELREKDLDFLKGREAELRKELFNLRFQAVMGTLSNPSRVSQVRAEVARVLTIMKEKVGA
ncbi:MAG: 50S ribosomal protein L29 [Leptospirillia bacterium]